MYSPFPDPARLDDPNAYRRRAERPPTWGDAVFRIIAGVVYVGCIGVSLLGMYLFAINQDSTPKSICVVICGILAVGFGWHAYRCFLLAYRIIRFVRLPGRDFDIESKQ